MSKPTVYFVDDCGSTLRTYQIIMRDEFDVITFKDPIAAVEVIKRHPPDLLVCDLMMPIMDGYSVIRKAKRYHPDLPVIVATSIDSAPHELAVSTIGGWYWKKGGNIQSLKELMKCVLLMGGDGVSP